MMVSLLLCVVLGWAPSSGALPESPGAFPDQFPLFPTMGSEGASGMVYLKQPWSPFGVSVDEDGRVRYDLRIVVSGLPETAGEVYRVWLTTPDLDPIADL